MHKIQLPSEVNEENLFQFLTKLGTGNDHNEISLDFKKVTHYTTDAIIAIVCTIRQWKSLKKKVRIKNQKQCNAYHYLVRINFFEQCGIKHKGPSDSIKDKNTQAYIEEVKDISLLAPKIACTIAPKVEEVEQKDDDICLRDCVEFVVSELSKNVEQHSKGTGFITAQYFASTDYVRVAIADNGIGIRESFANRETVLESDIKAVEQALDSKKSLTQLETLASKLEGQFIVVSNQAFITLDETKELFENRQFNGTLCAFSFKKSKVKGIDKALYSI